MSKKEDIKVQIAIRVLSVESRNSYGVDKKFLENIEPGDLILISSDWSSCFTSGLARRKHEVTITNKALTKSITTHTYLGYIFNRIKDFEQLELL